jgi:alpha-glucoside transport system permease protein
MARRIPTVTWIFVSPAILFLAVFLVYPVVNTVYLSFLNGNSTSFVGLSNYLSLFTSSDNLTVFRNNILWLVLFTGIVVVMGLLLAVLTNEVPYESVAKAMIFIPMAISFTAAAVIWRFMYVFQPQSFAQTGVINAILVGLGGNPVAWLQDPTVANLALIAAGIWMWTGFAMVVISAGLKGIPAEILEAARVDGATETQIFWRIILPMLSGVLVVVAVTMVINALKVFDLVYVMTFGNYDTDVIANRMFKEMFRFNDFGLASAIAVVLLVAIIPVMLVNLRRFQREAIR